MKIYFDIGTIKPTTGKELLINGFQGSNGTFKKTYTDKKLTKMQCHSAFRSFEDLLNICRTYFPKTTESRLAKNLFELNKEINISCSFCDTIHKLVFSKSFYPSKMDDTLCSDEKDKSGWGSYSYNDIVKLLKKK